MTGFWNFIKTQFIAVIALVVFLVWIFTGGCGKGSSKPTSDTVTHTSTVYVPQPPVQVPVYIPVASGNTQPVVIPSQYQPNTANLEALLKQYNELVTKYLTVRTYTDSVQLKDSSGNRVGVFHNNDIVSENEIKSRAPSYQLTFPHTTTTTVITNTNLPKRQLYWGLGLTSIPPTLVSGGHVGLLYKDTKDHVYTLYGGGMILPGRPVTPYVGLSYYTKIVIKNPFAKLLGN